MLLYFIAHQRYYRKEAIENFHNNELGSLLLKIDCIFNVPRRCIDEIVEELQFITCSASAPVIKKYCPQHITKP